MISSLVAVSNQPAKPQEQNQSAKPFRSFLPLVAAIQIKPLLN
jgi:hypothetical protein